MVVSNRWIRQRLAIEGHYRSVSYEGVGTVVYHSRKLPQCYTTERVVDCIIPIGYRRRVVVRLLSSVGYHRYDTDRIHPFSVNVGRVDGNGLLFHDGIGVMRNGRVYYYSAYTLSDGILDIYCEMVEVNVHGTVIMRQSTHHRVELYLSMDNGNAESVKRDDVMIDYDQTADGGMMLVVLPVCRDGYLVASEGGVVEHDTLVVWDGISKECNILPEYILRNDISVRDD